MSKRLFVGSLAYATTDDGLRAHFEAEGFVVKRAQVILDRETGRSRGFAFVELGDESDVQEAIDKLHERELDGRRLAIREAHDRGSSPRGDGPRRPSGPPGPVARPGEYRGPPDGARAHRPARYEGDDAGRGQGERRHFSKPDAPPAGRRKRKEKRRRDEGGRREDFGERRQQKKWRGGGGSSWDDYED